MRNNPNFFGEWEFSGDLSNIQNKLFFSYGKSKHFGLYFTKKLPKEQWNALISMEFPKNNNVSMLGIWLTKDFGVEGQIFGGSDKYTGFAILIAKYNKTMLIELRENDSKGKFSISSFQPQTNLTLSDDGNVSISINYTEQQRTSIAVLNNNQMFTIFDDRLRISVKKYWFSITGICFDLSTQPQNIIDTKDISTDKEISNEIYKQYDASIFSINSIYFSSTSISLQKMLLPEFDFISSYNDVTKETLKTNMESNKNNKTNKNSIEITAVDVLEEIDKLYKYSSILTTKSFVNNVVFYYMFPFSDAWQRRSIQIIREIPALRDNVSKIMKNASIVIKNIGNEIDRDLLDLMKSINNVTAKLYYSIFFDTKIEDSVAQHKEEFEGKGITKLLFISSIIEIVIFLLVVILKWRR